MRTTITLPDPVFENARELADKRKQTLSELISDALVGEMSRRETKPAEEFRLPTASGEVLMSWPEIKQMLDDEEVKRYLEVEKRNADARRERSDQRLPE